MEDKVCPSITKCKSLVDREEKIPLIIIWSYCFHDINVGLWTRIAMDDGRRWEEEHGRDPSTKK
jgi:hypothetical protein